MALYQIAWLYGKYRRATSVYIEGNLEHSWTFGVYVRYCFASWFVWNQNSSGIVVSVIFVSFVLLGAVAYCITVGSRAGPAAFKIFVWLVAPDGGANENNFAGMAIGAIMSLGGLLILAFVITLVHDSFTTYLEHFKSGHAPVMESGHVVILGYTDATISLIQELSHGYEESGGITIAILCEESKAEVEATIQEAGLDLRGSFVTVRSGLAHDLQSLQHVSVDTCSTVCVMPKTEMEQETRDAFVLRVLILLRGQTWPIHGKILVVCSLVRNYELFSEVGGPTTSIVMLGSFVAKLMVQCSRGWGLGMAVNSVLGFQDQDFYLERVPEHLVGCTFHQASLHFPHAVPLGLTDAEKEQDVEFVQLCPNSSRLLNSGEQLVLLAQSRRDLRATVEHADPGPRARCPRGELTSHRRLLSKQPENVIFIGWNERTSMMLLELDKVLPPTSHVVIFSPQRKDVREEALIKVQRRWDKKFEHITITHKVGDIGSRYQLEDMEPPIEDATRIFVLIDEVHESPAQADACTVTAIMQIRDIIRKHKKNATIPIVPQISDPRTNIVCENVNMFDYVSTNALQAQVLATYTQDPRIGRVLDHIISEGGDVEFQIRGLEEYLGKNEDRPEQITFFEAAGIVGQSGDVVLGWTLPGATRRRVVLNPVAKDVPREWSLEQDRLMVLHCSSQMGAGVVNVVNHRGSSPTTPR